MSGPLDGIKVIEVALWGFVPSAGGVLSDWGADVIKVEHAVTGDPQRAIRQMGSFKMKSPNPAFEHPNHGKRSIGIDIAKPDGRALLGEMVRDADVFLTSFLPAARRKLKIEVDDIRADNPGIIYARGSALGSEGLESGKGRVRHDRVLGPCVDRRQHHAQRHGRHDSAALRPRMATPFLARTSPEALLPRW